MYDGGGLKGGTGTIFVNDQKVGEGRIEHTQPAIFSADETADVGIDLGTPVVETIGRRRSRSSPVILKVTIEVHAVPPTTAALEHELARRRSLD